MNNQISDIVLDAIYFAAKKHKIQMRKAEEDMPMIMHPLSVGILLSQAGQNCDVVSAGILHDTLEDTKTTMEELKLFFNDNIAKLVYSASEKDKSLPWKQRKEETIKELEDATLETKLIVCADKVHNLTTHYKKNGKNSKDAWGQFKAGSDEQKWYYVTVYETIIKNEKPCELFSKYKDILNKIWDY